MSGKRWLGTYGHMHPSPFLYQWMGLFFPQSSWVSHIAVSGSLAHQSCWSCYSVSNFFVSALQMDGSCLDPSCPVTLVPCGAGTANFYMLGLEKENSFIPHGSLKWDVGQFRKTAVVHQTCLILLDSFILRRVWTFIVKGKQWVFFLQLSPPLITVLGGT